MLLPLSDSVCVCVINRWNWSGSDGRGARVAQVWRWGRVTDSARYERWGAGVEYHFQEFNEPYAPS